MADLTALAKESVKSLGPGAHLVSVLPSVLVVILLFALPVSSLYPWAAPRTRDGKEVADGLPAVFAAAQDLGPSGIIVLVLAVLVLASLIRPFHIAAVQLLEGYWTSKRLSFLTTLAVERHRRRRSMAGWFAHDRPRKSLSGAFEEVAEYMRRTAQRKRARDRSWELLKQYPRDPEATLPTTLGNLLRRAETSAGERYGLGTVVSYPRLYPHLSQRLDAAISNQLRLLDTSAALVLVFGPLGVLTVPIIWRPDVWLAMPLVFLAAAFVAYQGALRAARMYAELLHTAYDLHRFDMLKSMHRRLPSVHEVEVADNMALTRFLFEGQFGEELPGLEGEYVHPEPEAAESTLLPRNADTAADAKDVDDSNTGPSAS